jgi:tetratricopeptide (TPR) repeat protein
MSTTRLTDSKRIFWIALTALGLLLAACSPTAEKYNQDGNQAFTEQAYLEALELYQSAQIESPELAEPYYNAANALYRQGNYPQALEQIQMALQYIDKESLAESSFYNMGNAFFNSQELETAVEAYKQALLLNPDDQDAKYNLELALQQQEQDQQQEQSESDENQDSQQDQQEGEDPSENGENQTEQDQSQDGENQDDQNQEQGGEPSENGDQEQDQNPDGQGQPQDSQNQDSEQQSDQVPAPGQRMTAEQARQLLAAIADNMQTLQERLGQYFLFRQSPPLQDW